MDKEPYELVINSTKNQIEEFRNSLLWKDINNELDFWLEGFDREQDAIVSNAETENPSTASVLMHLGDISGRKKAVAFMKNILDVFLTTLEDKKDEPRHE